MSTLSGLESWSAVGRVLRVLSFLAAAVLAGCNAKPAIYSTDVAMLRSAIAAGANPNQKLHGWTPLGNMLREGSRTSSGRLRLESDPDFVPEARRLEVVRVLLDAGADPNALTRLSGYLDSLPLNIAARNCQVGAVELLLQRGADPVNFIGFTGTALHSVVFGCPKVVESERIAGMILDHVERRYGRANLQAFVAKPLPRMRETMPALSYAAWFDRPGVVAAMLARGVDVDERAQGVFGQDWTPLHLALAMGHADIANALVNAGANQDAVNDQGHVPIAVAGRYVRREMLERYLKELATASYRAGVHRDAVAAVRFYLAQSDNAFDGYVAGKGPLVMEHAPSQPPPPGWNGLEEAVKKRRAMLSKMQPMRR